MAASDSAVERSTAVSSMGRMKAPSRPRASSQLKSAVRALPTCRLPVGLGAKRTRMPALHLPDERNGVHGDRLAAADRVHALVGLALDAHARRVDAERARE